MGGSGPWYEANLSGPELLPQFARIAHLTASTGPTNRKWSSGKRPAMTSSTRYRCTACGVDTLSAKMCPKCGRRSTLVPLEEPSEAGPASPESPAGTERPSGRRSRNLFFIVGGCVVAVAAAVSGFALALCPGARDKGPAQPGKSGTTPSGTRRPVPRPIPRVNRPVGPNPCGQSFCFRAEGDFISQPRPTERRAPARRPARSASRARPNGRARPTRVARPDSRTPPPRGATPLLRTLASEHCFLLAPAPTQGRLWYVVLSHRVTLKEQGAQDTRVILQLDRDGFTMQPQAAAIFGLRPGAVKPDDARALVGKRLFFMRRTRHCFAPAGRPTVDTPFGALMASWAFGAAALCPFPPAPDARTWVDKRSLSPLVPARVLAVYRRWQVARAKAGDKNQVRWLVTPDLERNPPAELKKVRLSGEASTLPDGSWLAHSRLRVEQLDAVLNHLAAVRLELTHKGRRCAR